MTVAAITILALALPAQLVAAVGYGLSASERWAGALGATSLGLADRKSVV